MEIEINYQKRIITVIVIAVILGLLLGGYYFYGSLYKRFTNEKYKFSFSVPSGWKIATDAEKVRYNLKDAEVLLIKGDNTIFANAEEGSITDEKVTPEYLALEAKGIASIFPNFIKGFKLYWARPLKSRKDSLEVSFEGQETKKKQTIRLEIIQVYHGGVKYVFSMKSSPKDFDNRLKDIYSVIDTLAFF